MTYWKDKAALVTGGSAGLGLAIARQLVSQGARVAIVGRDQQRLDEAVESLRAGAAGGPTQVLGIRADVTQQDEVESMAGDAMGALGRLDLLVNCAGKSMRGAALDTTPDQHRELWELNFLAPVRCTQACMEPLLASKGHVVNVGSLAAKSASPYLGAYAASKFPLAAFSQQLRLELADRGLHVLLVCPGPIQRQDAGTRYQHAAGEMPDSARQPGGGLKLRGIDPDELAKRILLACQRRQPELVVPAKARIFFALSQLWPRLGDWIVRRMTGP